MKETKGITLVALVITIIVLLILAGVTVATLFGDDGVITKAEVAKMKTEFAAIKEQFDLFSVNETIASKGDYLSESLYATNNNLIYNTKEGTEGSIYDVIPDLKNSKYKDNFEIIKGDLIIDSVSEKEQEVAESVGIIVSPYIIVDGVLMSANDNLGLMDETGTVTIPSKVTAIGEGAFADVNGIKTVIIPGTVKEIRKNAFAENKTLENVIIEEGVELIGPSAFSGCRELLNVKLPNSVKEIRAVAFGYCLKLNKINLPNKLTKIEGSTFYQNYALTNIVIPDSVTTIENGAFSYCTNLTQINIPKNVIEIGSTTFYKCKNLENIIVAKENKNFLSVNGVLLNTNANKTKIIYISKGAIKGNIFVVPDIVTHLEGGSLADYSEVTKVEIPASVTNIDVGFFTSNINEITIDTENSKYMISNGSIYNKDGTILYYYFKNEASVSLAEGVEILEQRSFANAKNLTSITLPRSLTTIKTQVFAGLKNIKNIAIGENVSSISPLAFYGSGVTNIDTKNSKYYTFEDGSLYNKDKTILVRAMPVTGRTEFNIPEGVKVIGSSAFHNHRGLTKITIPNTVTTIGDSFNFCTSLTTIEIPNSVTSIGKICFANTSVKEIRIDNVKGSIPNSPWGCTIGDRGIIWLRK